VTGQVWTSQKGATNNRNDKPPLTMVTCQSSSMFYVC